MCWTLIVDYNNNVNYWVSLKFRIRHWRGTLFRGGGRGCVGGLILEEGRRYTS